MAFGRIAAPRFQPVDGPELGSGGRIGRRVRRRGVRHRRARRLAGRAGLARTSCRGTRGAWCRRRPVGCATIALDDEDGVWLAAAGPGAERCCPARDGAVEPARRPAAAARDNLRRGRPADRGIRQAAPSVAVVPQPGGAAVSVAPEVALTTGLEARRRDDRCGGRAVRRHAAGRGDGARRRGHGGRYPTASPSSRTPPTAPTAGRPRTPPPGSVPTGTSSPTSRRRRSGPTATWAGSFRTATSRSRWPPSPTLTWQLRPAGRPATSWRRACSSWDGAGGRRGPSSWADPAVSDHVGRRRRRPWSSGGRAACRRSGDRRRAGRGPRRGRRRRVVRSGGRRRRGYVRGRRRRARSPTAPCWPSVPMPPRAPPSATIDPVAGTPTARPGPTGPALLGCAATSDGVVVASATAVAVIRRRRHVRAARRAAAP